MTSAKQAAARAAISFLPMGEVIGVGTGSTVVLFIEALAAKGAFIRGAVSSSEDTTARLKAIGVEVFPLSDFSVLPVYIDGADEITSYGAMIKGGGAALTREKVIASVARQFICIAEEKKLVPVLGAFPIPVEVIPMARSAVARALVQLGGQVRYREGCVTDNGNQILDWHGVQVLHPTQLETRVNQIPGVVTVGIFAQRGADRLLLGRADGTVDEKVF